ncbi:histidyl-tRNA synthetase [Desulforamulus reducens MI-1]|uniref:Histidine--tRNA ligase n=1 Tax=Desulforamulus reducens (strain ATCC BAA-1160 / DSM 100696 / MI-1) TaxID=349161 RepID=SYH_DESRM|nr:histidine--tRNA ligase [Desulforamulus reducens]A4J2J1.1 RecName: Full=Histidine--tRNA ligase; AltName: Full=Histidyl-tRNA synthetase; Short=HisRS [Desulforamulus reducens MI-1]ABO49294.1 histidyl-tRNA synthetase [Desulforamulus reducens MI-1]
MLTTRPRGTNDILPGEVEKWQFLEQLTRQVCREYGYGEIRTPIFEHTELFARGVGETTDIVEKEMYTFTDRGDRSITLRPEGTASTVRAYVENKLHALPQPVKLYYTGPMFRYDRPQAGRYRQFHQFGVEVFGSNDPAIDAEVIAMAMDIYHRIGLQNLKLHINSVGCPECRPVLRQRLQEYFKPHLSNLCSNCQGRYERNPLRILDCKSEKCQEIGQSAPTTLDVLCPECNSHFESVKTYLDAVGVSYIIDNRLVRGLDYYTRTAFEIMTQDIGAQSSIGGGGRYNGLIEECGGPATPGIGFALGLERILLTAERQGITFPITRGPQVYIATVGSGIERQAFALLQDLRRQGIAAEKDYLGRSLKAQMKFAGKLDTRFVVILGEEEFDRGVAVVRDMQAGEQQEVSLRELVLFIKART